MLLCGMQVDLSNNNLGPEGGKAIASAISVAGSLTSADVRYNGLDESAKQQLRYAVIDRVGFELSL